MIERDLDPQREIDQMRALTREVARATYYCGCYVAYSVLGSSQHKCAEHALRMQFPFKISKSQYLSNHSRRGLHVLSGNVDFFKQEEPKNA